MTPSRTVTGYHVWQLRDEDGYLYSLGGDSPDRWEPRKPGEPQPWHKAHCVHPTPPDLHPPGGPVPHPDCTCGIHLARTYADLKPFLYTILRNIEPTATVFGCATGKGRRFPSLQTDRSYVDQPDRGWRVEYARPSALFVTDELDVATIAHLYGVPVSQRPADDSAPCPSLPLVT